MTLVVKTDRGARRATSQSAAPRTAAMTALERKVADAFQEAARAFARAWSADKIRESLRSTAAGFVASGAAGVIGSAPWNILEGTLSKLGDVFQQALVGGGRSLPTTGEFAYRFNYTDPRTLAYAEAQAARLVTAVTESTREAIASVIQESVLTQRTVDQTARALQDVVGVTERGAVQLSNAYERAFTSAIQEGATEAAARTLAEGVRDNLRERLVESRARTIARTEIMRAENAGRFLGWAQSVEAGDVDENSRKEWIAGDCPICEELDGEVVMWDEPFSIGTDMPPAHPNCVCTAVMLPPETPLSTEEGDTPDVEENPDLVSYDEQVGDVTENTPDTSDTPDAESKSWADMTDEEFDRAVVDDFDGTLQPFRDAGLTTTDPKIRKYPAGTAYEVQFIDADGKNVGRMERLIMPQTGEVSHEWFALDQAWQGQGLATAQAALAEDMYRARGMTNITVHANIDVGGYTWARMGYDWDTDYMLGFGGFESANEYAGDLLRRINILAAKAPGLTDELAMIDTLRQQLAQGILPPPIAFARVGAGGSEIGRQAMLGSEWYGRKAL